jgi:hypothetical protein
LLLFFVVFRTNGLFVNLTLKTCEGDSGEPSTSAGGYLTSDNVSAPTSALRTTEESNISFRSVRAGKFSSGKKIKYQETYPGHEFTYSTIDGKQLPQCVICSKILLNDSMKPVKLKRRGYKGCVN